MIDCTDEQLIEEVRRRGFVIRDAQIGRKWVGLTHEEKHQLNDALNLQGRFPIIETIEAKLKEKNT